MIRHRHMGVSDLEIVLGWAAEEGWNPGLDDAQAFHAADPDGFFLAEEDGTPVAAISVVDHAPDFAFLGLYLCRPTHRGRGIGHALWRDAIDHAGARTIGLDGVPEQQSNYARSGFEHAGRTTRHTGRVSGRRSDRIRPAQASDVPALVELEARASGWAKPSYMAAWFAGAETRSTHVLTVGATIAGAATVRRCRSGAKVGPVIADDDATAIELLRHVAALVDTTVTLDVPQQAAAFAATCEAAGLVPGFHTARMYRGEARYPRIGGPVLYAVTSLELG